jgi:serine phosphatase RsbU (regulator of sigma subunit)
MHLSRSIVDHVLGERKIAARYALAANGDWLDQDRTMAKHVQKRFLRRSLQANPGFEFFAQYAHAHQVGANYDDFILLPWGRRLAIAVWDVSGKRYAAAQMVAGLSLEHAISSSATAPRRRSSMP